MKATPALPIVPAPTATAPVWEVRLQKHLRHGDSRFDLDVAFTSAAHRLVLFGPSGAGKSQTLRMIAGIARPERGRICLAGRALYDDAARIALPARERRIGFMFQDYAHVPHLTVGQNIAFARQTGLLNPKPARHDPVVQRWVEAFHLEAIVRHYPHQISGGQRQRTALARALASEPAALLLDEPFAALDKPLREKLREELLGVQRELGLPLILITHDDDDVRVLAEDVVEIRNGRIVGDA